MEQDEKWEEVYKKSKPLISYSILIGINTEKAKDIANSILNGADINDLQIECSILSRMPIKDRHDYEFPEGIQDFVFYDGYKVKNRVDRKIEFVPLALTSVDSKRKFAMAMKF